jgi:hypothetical protein
MSASLITLTPIPQDCESIREFTRRIDGGGMPSSPGLWHQRFRAAGYYSVEVNLQHPFNLWQDIHEWCVDQFGENHYTWTGSTFWFETDQAAVLFALRWS